MKRVLLGLLIISPLLIHAQNISTIAGSGSSTFSGEGTPAISAGIPNPGGGVFDKNGNYFFVDAQNSHRVRKITPSGIISTVAGNGMGGFMGDSGPATNARLKGPQGLALDTSGNLYIADAQNNRIRKVDALTGIITTVAGTGSGPYTSDGITATTANISNPQDVCVDKFGNLYIADMFNYRIRKVNTTGIISTYAGNGNHGYSGEGTLADTSMIGVVVGLCSDTSGNVYIASNTVCRVLKISPSNIITTAAGDGLCTYSLDGIFATSAQIAPLKIFVDNENNLFIADKFNRRTYKVSAVSGILDNIAGNGIAGDSGDGRLATAASIFAPTGVALDPCGNLYIPSDGSASAVGSGRRIRKITFNPASIATVSVGVTPNDTVCAGTPVTYTAITTGGSTMSFKWYKNGSVVAGATSESYTYTPAMGDTVRCVYTGVDICSFTGNPGSNTIKMVVTPLTPPIISLTSAPASTAAIGSTVTVNATVGSAGGSYSIKWYKNSMLFASTGIPTTTFTKGVGTEVITAKVSSTAATGCYDTTTSAAHSVSVASVSVHNIVPEFSVNMYPNPAHNELYIQGAVSYYRILNIVGTAVQQGAMKDPVVDVSLLPVGMYLLEATGAEGQKMVLRFSRQ